MEHAVLVGEFPAIDDPEGQRLLQSIKVMQPKSLALKDPSDSAQSLASVREMQREVKKRLGKGERGPMGHAFMTRNPLLPREYFVPQAVDEEVAKWNKNVEYSLLKCPGKYSIKVATFRGRVSLKAANDGEPDATDTRSPSDDDPLVVAAQHANDLTRALREKGWEAYEFHDRRESYVTVGSFDSAQQLPTGQYVVPDRDAQIIISTFGARSPNNVFNRPRPAGHEARRAEEAGVLQPSRRRHGRAGFLPQAVHRPAVRHRPGGDRRAEDLNHHRLHPAVGVVSCQWSVVSGLLLEGGTPTRSSAAIRSGRDHL